MGKRDGRAWTWRVQEYLPLLFAVVAYTISFVDATDDSPIVFVLDTNKDVCVLKFFFESFIPFICPKRCLNLSHQLSLVITGYIYGVPDV